MKSEFRHSRHTKDQMVLRGISKGEIIDAVLKGAKRLRGRKIIGLYGKVEVVFLKKPCHYFIITAYWR